VLTEGADPCGVRVDVALLGNWGTGAAWGEVRGEHVQVAAGEELGRSG
jgi:hypothetical protein